MGGIGDFFEKIAPVVPIVGDVIGGVSSAKEARKNRAFQERMSNTSHQREVKDLRAAGLNPVLSATGGAGASTPSGAVAQVPDYGRGVSNALQLRSQIKLQDAQANNLDALTRETNQKYWLDRYFVPLERMQGLTLGRYNVQGAKQTALNTEALVANTRQGLLNLQEDLRGKTITNDQAKQILDQMTGNPELVKFMASAPYADQEKIDRILQNGDVSSIIKLLLEIFRPTR